MSTDQKSRTSSGRHRVLWRGAKRLLWIALFVVVIVGGAGALLSRCSASLNFDLGATRNHLKEIPIAPAACPYVRVLHQIANDVQRNEPIPVLTADLSPRALAWPSPSRVRFRDFRQSLVALDREITVSNPHFPPAVRVFLSATQRASRRGRIQVAQTYYGLLPSQPSSDLLSAGTESFGYASDLVGKQCGVSLQADSSTMPNLPFMVVLPPSPKRAPHAPTTSEHRGARRGRAHAER